MYDLIILGGGPAGLTAAVYALRKRLNVLLITRDLGGKTNYRLQLPFVEKHLVITGEEVVSRFANEIDYLEFSRVFGKAEKVEKTNGNFKVTTREGETYEAHALIVATGALGRLMEVPGEKEFMMRGLCYSAVSYAPLFIDRDVGERFLNPNAIHDGTHSAERLSVGGVTWSLEQTWLSSRPLLTGCAGNGRADASQGSAAKQLSSTLSL
jgi:flavin-dependent dehydrogenase